MSLAQQSRPFIQHIDKWLTALPAGRLSQVAAKPGETAQYEGYGRSVPWPGRTLSDHDL